jgi:hypothetical protein
MVRKQFSASTMLVCDNFFCGYSDKTSEVKAASGMEVGRSAGA